MKKLSAQQNALPKPQMDANELEEIDAVPELEISNKANPEKKLKDSELKYRRVFEESMDGLILWDNQNRIVDINFSAVQMFGLSRDNLIGSSIFDLFKGQEEKRQEILKHINTVSPKGKSSSSMIIEVEAGKMRNFDYSTKFGIVEGLNQTVIIDVTEKVAMQEQLRKSDRLNIIGELAAGIAHEIRNPMTALKGFIQLLEPSIKADHSMYYDVITTELARIDSIISEFLILAKPQAIRFQEMDISQIMKETVDLLSAQAVLYNVIFQTQYENNLPHVYCEPNQLKKVFINIIKNAIEVMPNGGTISIKINNVEKGYVQISIQDEGSGIPKDKIEKLGEPFYTTKERGTGLGLMVSYRIIDEHQGKIHIESEEGNGSTFYLILPVNHSE